EVFNGSGSFRHRSPRYSSPTAKETGPAGILKTSPLSWKYVSGNSKAPALCRVTYTLLIAAGLLRPKKPKKGLKAVAGSVSSSASRNPRLADNTAKEELLIISRVTKA